ncbi:MAG: exodeoxyribonuclease VII large subunit [Rhodocyclaceae bacterium]|nr:exodeoxyribonuclease VII large subunit [Rhodocyclaceae bacterium]
MPSNLPGLSRTGIPEYDEVLSVSALNQLARTLLEKTFPPLRISGELSNLTRAASGHLYFTLKDSQAQVRCTMWRNRAQLLGFRPENGMQVEARALVTLYEARGDFQLSVEAMLRAGIGSLYEAFIRLKERLTAQGLFDPAAKRALPHFPRRIGIVTSPAAAAFQDVLAAVRRRAPHLEVVLYPALVQGEAAPVSLIEAMNTVATRHARDRIDLLLLVRGGGSLEDLWAFNDEGLAHALRACPVPVISGVGHETDFTIADLAADVRAATPTGAAELATAGYHAAAARLPELARTLSRTMQARLLQLGQRVDRTSFRLVHPGERLRRSRESLERLHARLESACRLRIERSATRSHQIALRLSACRPQTAAERARCERLADRLEHAFSASMRQRHERLRSLAAHLDHLDPSAVLARGYSITRNSDGVILRSSAGIASGSTLSVELASGRIDARVTGTKP